jgi:hypothetical protein
MPTLLAILELLAALSSNVAGHPARSTLEASRAVAPVAPVVSQENVRRFYLEYTRLTREPHRVAPLTAALCTTMPPSRDKLDEEKALTGPHHMARVHLYANVGASAAIDSNVKVFPAGSVIVKEKLGQSGEVSGVGGMIKREAGYDPANGDWEYFYQGKDGPFATGRIRTCIECHRRAQATDHVFSVWSFGR